MVKKKSEVSTYYGPCFVDTLYIALAHSLNLPIHHSTRDYTTAIATTEVSLNPHWVTGFTDAEGSFSCIISQRPSGA